MSYLRSSRDKSEAQNPAWQTPSGRSVKRALDLFIALPALLVFAPVFVVIAILIRLDSAGPIFYVSDRVGQDYQTFPMVKFRTMYVDADERLDDLRHLNQYRENGADDREEREMYHVPSWQQYQQWNENKGAVLVQDDAMMTETTYRQHTETEKESVFLKLERDPRVTPVGRFLRNTSLDEIPQLFNVLAGHLSIVGNRPLPPYEAEQLTCDGDVERFFAPAGITGLWQVTKRGTEEVTPEERIALDIEYARTCSLWTDLRILAHTVPALWQEENV